MRKSIDAEQRLIDVLHDIRWVVDDPSNQLKASMRLEVSDLLEQLHHVDSPEDSSGLCCDDDCVPQCVRDSRRAWVVMADLPIDSACIHEDVLDRFAFRGDPCSFEVDRKSV